MARLTIFGFLKGQLRTPLPVVRTSLKGKTVLVVGANTGLGFEACKHFAGMGPAKLIMGCRSKERGQGAVDRLKKETNFEGVELWLIDLSTFASVSEFATRAEEEDIRLDIVVMNAAIMVEDYTSPDGWESHLQVNVLSTSLLSLLLLPRMIKTHERFGVVPRLVVVASEVHFWTELDDEVLQKSHGILTRMNDKEYRSKSGIMSRRYQDTKLFNIFFVRKLASLLRAQGNPVVVTAPNPGFCSSELARDVGGVVAFAVWAMKKLLAFTAEEGSRQLVYAAIGGVDDEVHGQYISGSEIREPSDFVIGEKGKDVESRLWNEMIEILAKADTRAENVTQVHLKG